VNNPAFPLSQDHSPILQPTTAHQHVFKQQHSHERKFRLPKHVLRPRRAIRATTNSYQRRLRTEPLEKPKAEPSAAETSRRRTSRPPRPQHPHPRNAQLTAQIIALYSCQPTVSRVKRYTPDCVYDDQFVYANDRYKMAGQWFALPALFKASINESYEVIRSDDDMIQFKNKQSWTFRLLPKTATITGLVSLSLDPATRTHEFMQVKYHKDQANEKDYSHEGLGFSFKKWQADHVVKHMDAPELKEFEADREAAKEHVRTYGTGKEEGGAPKRDFTT
jgi:hypothetical protein